MADNIITSARSMVSQTEGQYKTLGMPANTLTPATLTAMVGLYNGGAIQVPTGVSDIIGGLKTDAFSQINTAGITELNTALSVSGVSSAADLTTAKLNSALSSITANVSIPSGIKASIASLTATGSPLSNTMDALGGLSDLTSKLMPAGNPAAFGKFLQQAQSHVIDSIEVNKAMNFIKTTDFSDYGTGVKDFASMADRGLTNSIGNLADAGKALESAGSMFAGVATSKFGQPGGIIDALRNNKMANATNLNQKLIDAGVDPADAANPLYATKVKSVLDSVNDPSILSAVAEQFRISPSGGLPSVTSNSLLTKATSLVPVVSSVSSVLSKVTGSAGMASLADFGDITKVAGPFAASVKGGFTGISEKFTDVGAKLSNPATASRVLSSINLPSADKLTAMAKSLEPPASSLVAGVKGQLSGLVSNLGSTVKTMTGTGAGPMGVPSLTDIMGPLTGQCMEMQAAVVAGVTPTTVAGISSAVSRSVSFFSTAGIDLTTPPSNSLNSCMNFATNLHKFGADSSGLGTSTILGVIASDDAYGQAIKVSLAEGKNNAELADVGATPPVTNAATDYTKERDKLDKQVMNTLYDYAEVPGTSASLWHKKAEILKKRNTILQQIKTLDEQYANDPDLVTSSQSLITQNSELIASIYSSFPA